MYKKELILKQEKKNSCVVQVEGGIGKNLALTSLIKKLKTLYNSVYVFSPYPDLFNGIATRSFPFDVQYGYEDYFLKADDIFYPEPYRQPDFRKHRIGICEAFFRCCNIDYNGEKPEIKFTAVELDLAKKIKKDIGTFIIVQFHGGVSPYNDPRQPQPNINIVKNYPTELAEELVKKIREKYKCNVVNFAIPNENKINGTIELQMPYRSWFALLNESETFISIDSTLQHAGAAIKKHGYVLWGGTDPKMYGYEMHANITGECENIHCSRPYFVPSSDIVNNQVFDCPTKKCMKISPDKIMSKLKFDIKAIQQPTIDLTAHICQHNCGNIK